MTQVFLSYKCKDRPRATALAEALREEDLTVWMDIRTPGGAGWRQTITENLEAAGCVVVLWSEASVAPTADFVHDEATRAKNRGILLPVKIDDVAPPLGFGEVQALDLVGWKGSRSDPRFRDLVASIRATLAREPRPVPQSALQRRRVLAAMTTAGALLVGIIGFTADIAGLQGTFCRIPGVHALCAAQGWGGVPTRVEEELWQSRPEGDCETLRSYLTKFPAGAFAEQAQRLLQAASSEQEERWELTARSLPLFVPRDREPAETQALAREKALKRGEHDAFTACEGFRDSGEFRLQGARAEVAEWLCEPLGEGFVCGFEGKGICSVKARKLDRWEVCP